MAKTEHAESHMAEAIAWRYQPASNASKAEMAPKFEQVFVYYMYMCDSRYVFKSLPKQPKPETLFFAS